MAHSSFTDRWSEEARAQLGQLAAHAIVHAVMHGRALPVDVAQCAPELQQQGACFVTLLKNGELRGCIGSLEPRQPLACDVADNACSACLRDPRFAPVEGDELRNMTAEVSVLSPLTEIQVASEQALLEHLQPFRDGLVIDDGYHRATFLPSVWEQLPEKREFVEHLKLKAGMNRQGWTEKIRCYVYTVEKFSVKNLLMD